jgi:hypothetical protein
MKAHPAFSNATSPLSCFWERVRVRVREKAVEVMKLTKRQIEVTMFATGVGVLEGFQDGRLKIDHSS